jgi:hypothetical protein
MTLKVHGKLVPNTVLRFPSRTDDETWAVKAETALPAAATVVAIAEEAQGRAASKRAADRRGGEETGRREPGADGV